MSGHWKFWHDVRGRYLIALLVIGWQVYATTLSVAMRHSPLTVPMGAFPSVCEAAPPGAVSWQKRLAELEAGPRTVPGWDGRPSQPARDYRLQAQHCAAGEQPTEGYAHKAEIWMRTYHDTVWKGMMPILMLFLGILLAVGPPFSGESAEASTLTFSLPWTRMDWLQRKVLFTWPLLVSLMLIVLIAGMLAVRFPGVEGLSGADRIHRLGLGDTLPSMLSGLVGIALGIGATMITRSALAGAICASVIAYLIALLDISRFFPRQEYGDFPLVGVPLMDVTQRMGVLVAFTVIACVMIMAWFRLRRTDF